LKRAIILIVELWELMEAARLFGWANKCYTRNSAHAMQPKRAKW